jgi:hypothetical protein
LEIVLEYIRISAMKAWQIFGVGMVVLVAALLLPSYEPILAGLAATVMVAVVVLGFLFRPGKDMFYLHTTLVVSEPDYPLAVEHDRIAIRVELARLWLLFLPTFAAVAFLIVTSARGTTWQFSLLDRFWETSSHPIFLGIRAFLVLVVGLLSTWVSERWVMRDAEACTADTVSAMAGCFLFQRSAGGILRRRSIPVCPSPIPKVGKDRLLQGLQPPTEQDRNGMPVPSARDRRTRSDRFGRSNRRGSRCQSATVSQPL